MKSKRCVRKLSKRPEGSHFHALRAGIFIVATRLLKGQPRAQWKKHCPNDGDLLGNCRKTKLWVVEF